MNTQERRTQVERMLWSVSCGGPDALRACESLAALLVPDESDEPSVDARIAAAVAAERARCLAWVRWSRRSTRETYDPQRAEAEIESGAPAPKEQP